MKSFESHVAIFLTKAGQKGTTVIRTISFCFEYCSILIIMLVLCQVLIFSILWWFEQAKLSVAGWPAFWLTGDKPSLICFCLKEEIMGQASPSLKDCWTVIIAALKIWKCKKPWNHNFCFRRPGISDAQPRQTASTSTDFTLALTSLHKFWMIPSVL